MPDAEPNEKIKTTMEVNAASVRSGSTPWRSFPWATLLWLIAAGAVLLLGTVTVSLRDKERFVDDVRVVVGASTELPDDQTLLRVTAGTFAYGEVALRTIPLESATYNADNAAESLIADAIFVNLDGIAEVRTSPTVIDVVYVLPEDDPDFDPERLLNRVRRFVLDSLDTPRETISGEVLEDPANTIRFTTTEESFQAQEFVPALIPQGSEEVYADREAMENGSELAQLIADQTNAVLSLTIRPDSLLVTRREGAVDRNVAASVERALNVYYPRANLTPTLWSMGIAGSSDKLISITPVDTGIPLLFFALTFAAIEFALAVALRSREERLLRPLVRVVGVFFFFWSLFGLEPMWDALLGTLFPDSPQLVHPSSSVIQFVAQHLELVIISSLIVIPTGLLLGIMVTRASFRELLPLVTNLVNSGQTVPTIAIVAFMAPLIGFGFWPAIIALIAYGLLPVLRNTIAGLESVDASIIDSARGMGMTPAQILLRVEMPVASSIIMAGIRTSMVVNVGTATLGAFVGSGGLGTPIASGLAMSIDPFVLLGALPAALLAILVDYILGRVEFVLTPRGLRIA